MEENFTDLKEDKNKEKRNIGSKLSDFAFIERIGKVEKVKSYKKIYIKKEINLSKYETKEINDLKKRIKSLENTNHQNLVKYYTSFEENNNLYLIMEYIPYGSINTLIKKNKEKNIYINEENIWIYLIQCIRTIIYLYQNEKVIHGNIKPENILIEYDKNNENENNKMFIMKITDYGIKSNEGINKDVYLKEDMHMIGKIFYNLMNNRIMEKQIYEDINLSKYYSSKLKDIIITLINDDISPKDIYIQIINIYSDKYLNFTSLYSILFCLLNIPDFFENLNKDIELLLKYDENNIKEKFPFINILIKLTKKLKNMRLNNFNSKLIRNICLELRKFIYINYLDKSLIKEINLKDFITDLFRLTHNILNANKSSPIIYNNINNEEEENNINNTNIKSIIKTLIKENKSIIYDLFYYIKKIENKCKKCQNIEYSYNINFLCQLYPERASEHFKNKQKLNIIDLFKHYRKKREYEDEKCKICHINNIFKTKIFYNSPIYLILLIDDFDENKIELNIEQSFNIMNYVEKIDVLNTIYNLIGIIFLEENKKKEKNYSSINKYNNEWYYFDGNSVKLCNFDFINHKKISMLFYSKNI